MKVGQGQTAGGPRGKQGRAAGGWQSHGMKSSQGRTAGGWQSHYHEGKPGAGRWRAMFKQERAAGVMLAQGRALGVALEGISILENISHK